MGAHRSADQSRTFCVFRSKSTEQRLDQSWRSLMEGGGYYPHPDPQPSERKASIFLWWKLEVVQGDHGGLYNSSIPTKELSVVFV